MTHGDQNKEILTDSDWNRDTTNNTFSNRDTIYNDSPKDMTYSRRIARYLSRYHCYFPQHVRKDEEGGGEYPKLDMAWAHFEHFVLPRCFSEKNHVENNIRARPDEIEEDTMLYPRCGTTLTHMAEFGVGVGLYFSTVKFFAIMTFIAGIINIPAMIYFASDEYSPDGRQNIENLLKVSAVCAPTKLQPCPNCRESDWAGRFPSDSKDRFAVGKASDGSELAFIKVNDCNIDGFFGISTYACLVFAVLAVFVFLHHQKIKAVKFDDAMQTSTDYSIKIMNPPPDAKNPDFWKEFFESEETKFDATLNLCTIVIDNHLLIKTLVDRRRWIAALNDLLPLGKI